MYLTYFRQVLSEIAALRHEIEQRKNELSSHQQEEKQHKRILNSKQEKVAKISLQHDVKVNSLSSDIDAINKCVRRCPCAPSSSFCVYRGKVL